MSHEITAGKETPITAFPSFSGATTEKPSSKFESVIFYTDDHPRCSATPGPVEPAPVSAADFPQYTISKPSDEII